MATGGHTHLRGCWGEAQAIAWLSHRGYEVYVGFGNTSADLVAVRDGEIARVEVKSLTVRPEGGKPFMTGVKPEKFDMLLGVLPDGTILVNPTRAEVYGGL